VVPPVQVLLMSLRVVWRAEVGEAQLLAASVEPNLPD
jgi:hypothetical protein